MRHRWILSPTLAVAAMLAIAGSVLAGGSATVTLDTPEPPQPSAGEPITIGFTLLQHGELPVSWPDAFITASNVETNETLRFDANPLGPEGHYVATVTLPAEGAWQWAIRTRDLEVVTPMRPLTVSAAAGTPALQGPVLVGGAVALAVIALLLGLVILRRARPTTAEDRPVTVRA